MRLSLFAAAAFYVFSLPAHADTYFLFDLNATFADGGSATGTVTLDRTTGTFSSAAISILDGGSQYTLNRVAQTLFLGSNGTYSLDLTDESTTDYLQLYLPETSTSFAVFDGAEVESDTYYPGNPSTFDSGIIASTPSYSTDVAFGAIEPPTTTVTPEPSSIALLGTGLLGVAGISRKRFA